MGLFCLSTTPTQTPGNSSLKLPNCIALEDNYVRRLKISPLGADNCALLLGWMSGLIDEPFFIQHVRQEIFAAFLNSYKG
jgi:hypothetical protein